MFSIRIKDTPNPNSIQTAIGKMFTERDTMARDTVAKEWIIRALETMVENLMDQKLTLWTKREDPQDAPSVRAYTIGWQAAQTNLIQTIRLYL